MRNKNKVSDKELLFVSDAKQGLYESHSAVAGLLLLSFFALLAALVTWASLTSIDEVTVGSGKIIPSSKVKTVQSLEGGIVEKIFVHDGMKVTKGQALLQIDDTLLGARLEEQMSKQRALEAKVLRLKAEITDKKTLIWPPSLRRYTELKAIESSLFKARIKHLASSLQSLKVRVDLLKEEMALNKQLKGTGAVSKVELLQLKSKLIELQSQFDEKKAQFIEQANKELNAAVSELSAIRQNNVANVDKVKRTVLRAPVNGIVQSLSLHTDGQVIKSGEELMEIIPLEDTLLIEARIKPQDVGFIAKGQPATVKISAYDFSIYGGLKGTVEKISADSLTDQQGADYYQVLIKTNQHFLKRGDKRLELIPGMTVTIHILTGKKTVMNYLLKPILKTKNNALHER